MLRVSLASYWLGKGIEMSATWFLSFVRMAQDGGLVRSQADIARLLGKSDNTVSRWCISGVPAHDEKLVRLACAAIARGIDGWE